MNSELIQSVQLKRSHATKDRNLASLLCIRSNCRSHCKLEYNRKKIKCRRVL